MRKRPLLIAMKCKECNKEFVCCIRSGKSCVCYNCKNGTSLEEVQKELDEMSPEEYQSFMDDIEEYNKS